MMMIVSAVSAILYPVVQIVLTTVLIWGKIKVK